MTLGKQTIAYVLVSFLTGILVAYGLLRTDTIPTLSGTDRGDLQEFENNYTFINPLLFCGDTELSRSTSATAHAIEEKVDAYIQKEKSFGHISEASVYYRDLKGGPWALINGDLMSTPGSLLKVPVVLSIYRHAEKETDFLSQKIVFDGGYDASQRQSLKPAEKITPGNMYTVENLVHYTLIDSDNNAALLLTQLLSQKEITDSFTRLGIETPDSKKSAYIMDVRTYASFFRILYNASYLDRDTSEYVLSLLAQSKFTDGIVAGVPKNTLVAHKFGEAEFPDGATQLHDCGIVYKPTQPYLLCIMTHGNDIATLSKSLQEISKIVYDVLGKQSNL
jgi:beta-lactamase class A